jgi:hypothetical protein
MRDADGIVIEDGQTCYVVEDGHPMHTDIIVGEFKARGLRGSVRSEDGVVTGCTPCNTFTDQARAFRWYKQCQEHAIENRNQMERDRKAKQQD